MRTGWRFSLAGIAFLTLVSLVFSQQISLPELKTQYYNSPSSFLVLPECIWAPAIGGGTWMTEVQIIPISDINVVEAVFLYGGGNYRGPFNLIVNAVSGQLYVFNNILETLDSLDPDPNFSYNGRVGAVLLLTTDSIFDRVIAMARTNNGPYGKTFNALADVDANLCSFEPFRPMAMCGLVSNANFRTSIGGVNISSEPLDVYFEIRNQAGELIGSFNEIFVGNDFKAFNPFVKAGIPSLYDSAYLIIVPTGGSGRVMFFGATANNTTNDPAALSPFQLR
ncbi:MAG: hypothetical protein ACUVWQ_06665 [Candidatus Aminicenantales bacterium]